MELVYLQEKLQATDSDDGGRFDARNCEIEIGSKNTQRTKGGAQDRTTHRPQGSVLFKQR